MPRPANWSLKYRARGWQRRALELWLEREQQGIVEVVTGGGKTVFAEMCILQFTDANPNGHIVIVVPTVSLLDQWYVSLQEELAVDQTQISVYSGESKARQASAINLMVLNTARSMAPKLSGLKPTFLIVDECHRAGSPKNARALSGQYAATLGLSATPMRAYDEGFETYLQPALGPIIFRYDYNAASRDGILSPFDLVNIAVDLLPDEEANYDELTRKIARAFHASRAQQEESVHLKKLLQARARVISNASFRIPAAISLALEHPNEKTLLFHEQIAAADTICSHLLSKGTSAALYHSKLAPAVRRDNLRLFRNGVVEVLVSCRALDEGTNVPETSVAIIASSTASPRQRIQRMGRVLRPAPDKALATIYTIYAGDQEERRLLAESQQLVEASSVSWRQVRVDG